MNTDLQQLEKMITRAETRGALEFIQQSAPPLILVDVSGSMNSHDGGDASRYDRMVAELRTLDRELGSTNYQLVAFSSDAVFTTLNTLTFEGNGTDLSNAFYLSGSLSPSHIVLISDGLPSDEDGAIHAAALLNSRIDTIYVGDADNEWAKAFMKQLATANRGQFLTDGQSLLVGDGSLARKIIGFLA